jgi:hypothetical protein
MPKTDLKNQAQRKRLKTGRPLRGAPKARRLQARRPRVSGGIHLPAELVDRMEVVQIHAKGGLLGIHDHGAQLRRLRVANGSLDRKQLLN